MIEIDELDRPPMVIDAPLQRDRVETPLPVLVPPPQNLRAWFTYQAEQGRALVGTAPACRAWGWTSVVLGRRSRAMNRPRPGWPIT